MNKKIAMRVFRFSVYTFLGWGGAFLSYFTFLLIFLSIAPKNEDGTVTPPIWLIVPILFLPLTGPTFAWFVDRKRSKPERLRAKELEEARIEKELQTQLEQQQRENAQLYAKERVEIRELVELHKSALERNLRRAVRRNDYGAVEKDNTREIVWEFLTSFDLPKFMHLDDAVPFVISIVESIRDEKLQQFDYLALPNDGHEFEKWVADALISQGWEASVTPGSGDQGVDVIAKRNHLKVGIQCKLYSSSVGNKAVQEAIAGRIFHGLDKVAVVTNADFTKSAEDLANSSGVFLLSVEQLADFESEITRKSEY